MSESFLVCPVRDATPQQIAVIEHHNAIVESTGEKVYWPHKHTKQDGDPIGIRICRDNREAMFTRDKVRVWYDPKSRGSCFDIGMAFVFERTHPGQIVLANLDDFLRSPASPQFSLLLSIVAHTLDRPTQMSLLKRFEEYPPGELFRHTTLSGQTHTLRTPPEDTGALCVYGMIFAVMRSVPRRIVLDIPIASTPDKSFNNLLLWLAEYTKNGSRTI